MKEVCIIGGGASGMMAAVAAAGKGANVTILEKQSRIGKKLLATGNGRCNLSNRDFCVWRDYRSHNADRLADIFSRFGVQDTVDFFQSLGLLITERNGGYLYPRSLQAAAVSDVLRMELERLCVRVLCDCQVQNIHRKNRYTVDTDQGRFSFDRIILACGSPAGTNSRDKLGGFELAGLLGLSVFKPLPALTALKCGGSFFKALAGVRCDASVSIRIQKPGQNELRYEERGELQLADYGISGIPVFQLSRYAAEALDVGARVTGSVDFVPEYDVREWERFCRAQLSVCRNRRADQLVNGIVHKKIGQLLLSRCQLKADDIVVERLFSRFHELFSLMRSFPVEIEGVKPMESAQVCAGGVALTEVDQNLQSKRLPGLYLCGEMLDVDGRCGGYNLQWAWTSGQIAGRSAAGGDRFRLSQ